MIDSYIFKICKKFQLLRYIFKNKLNCHKFQVIVNQEGFYYGIDALKLIRDVFS